MRAAVGAAAAALTLPAPALLEIVDKSLPTAAGLAGETPAARTQRAQMRCGSDQKPAPAACSARVLGWADAGCAVLLQQWARCICAGPAGSRACKLLPRATPANSCPVQLAQMW